MMERKHHEIWISSHDRRYFLEDLLRLKGQRVLIDGNHMVDIGDSTPDDRELLRRQEETGHEWALLQREHTKIWIEEDGGIIDPLPAIQALGGPEGVTITHTHPRGGILTFNPLERTTS